MPADSLTGRPEAVVSVSGVAARPIDWALEGVLTRFAPDGLP
jgi:hypothetical protein